MNLEETNSVEIMLEEETVPAGSAVLRAFRILEVIATSSTPPQLAEICKRVDLPKPTVFRILSTLEYSGLVGREPGSKRYQTGQRLNRLSGEVLLNSPMRAARHAILEELVEQVGETCNLTIPNGNTVMYLDRVEASWPLRINLGAGSSVPLHATASGKLFLSYMNRRARERFIRQSPLVRHTPKTLTDPSRLSEELDRVREQGYATDNEEFLTGICCVAVPVFDVDSRVVAALAMHAPVSRMSLSDALDLLPMLKQAADDMAQTVDW